MTSASPRRFAALAALTAFMIVLLAAPALAHGGGGSDASNYLSVVRAVVAGIGGAGGLGGEPVEVPQVSWRVLANDALLQVRNDSSDELTVPGYQNEPFLRIGPDGVLENRNAPSYYLSSDRFAETPVPESATADAKPNWVKVSVEPVYQWHDHRIHWMSPTLPPQVKADATAPVKVNDWLVPFEVDGRRLAVSGTLRWVPPPPWWPWMAGALVLVTLPVALAALRGERRDARRLRTLRAAAAVFAVAVVVNFVHGVDDLIAVPATVGENLVAGLQTFVPILIAAWGTWRAWRGRPGAAQALFVAGAVIVLTLGVTHAAILASSQVASRLPDWFSRLVVSIDIALIVPTALAAVATGDLRAPPEESVAEPVAETA